MSILLLRATKILIFCLIFILVSTPLGPTVDMQASFQSLKSEVITTQTETAHQIKSSYHINYQLADLELYKVDMNGEIYQMISYSGGIFPSQPGKPLLPYEMKIIGIPAGAEVSYTIVYQNVEIMDGINILPCPKPMVPPSGQQISWDDEMYEYFTDMAIYSHDAFYPESVLDLNDRGFIRDQEVIRARIYPCQFNPVKHQLRLYRHIEFDIIYTGNCR